jgi:hypothetical protein
MALEKLKISVEDDNRKYIFPNHKEIAVLYNPNRITIQKAGWQISSNGINPMHRDTPASLTVELFFDTSAPDPEKSSVLSKAKGLVLTSGSLATDVREHTQPIYDLMNPQGTLKRPPLCRLVWGGEQKLLYFKESLLFQGLLQQVTQNFTHFTAQGMPVRATLNCTFIEWADPEYKQKERNPIDDPIRIVKQGETLSSIATEEYGDPALWRVIANANRLANPRKLAPGMPLTVPPLPPEGGS